MSDDIVYIQKRRIDAIYDHPNADKLVILKVGHFTVVHAKEDAESFRVGKFVLHVPTDICICPVQAEALGVDAYCRKVRYQNEGDRVPCRVVAARLRGVPSFGFIIKNPPDNVTDYDLYYGVWKYEPPAIPENLGGEKEREEHPQFPVYTKIRRIQYHPNHWTEGLPVRVTEKIHGTNVRLGVVQVDGEWRFMVGSHNVIRRQYVNRNHRGQEKLDAEPRLDKYWTMLDERVMNMLGELCDGSKPAIVFGEMFGPGVQDLDYGRAVPELRVFDIMVDGEYLDWDLVRAYCEKYMIPTVPLLFQGGFTWCLIDQYVDGSTLICTGANIKSRYKGREGIVITPLHEAKSPLGNRLIAKAISADYESRKGGTEYH